MAFSSCLSHCQKGLIEISWSYVWTFCSILKALCPIVTMASNCLWVTTYQVLIRFLPSIWHCKWRLGQHWFQAGRKWFSISNHKPELLLRANWHRLVSGVCKPTTFLWSKWMCILQRNRLTCSPDSVQSSCSFGLLITCYLTVWHGDEKLTSHNNKILC